VEQKNSSFKNIIHFVVFCKGYGLKKLNLKDDLYPVNRHFFAYIRQNNDVSAYRQWRR
jgi:hypothetical protein